MKWPNWVVYNTYIRRLLCKLPNWKWINDLLYPDDMLIQFGPFKDKADEQES